MKFNPIQKETFAPDTCNYNPIVEAYTNKMLEDYKWFDSTLGIDISPDVKFEAPVTFAYPEANLEKVYVEKINDVITIKCKHGEILKTFTMEWI